MSASLPSDEVAEDYKGSLEDLVTNDRYQISNLTLIAKENIEHAEAISRVLQNHINRAPPARKLPALYVLDSIVKNVGSPYTVYFGRNLHQTFMLAYSQVDAMVRRKMEEMLKTWREPVPGLLSTTPVFPIASTQSIVDSLNRFRSSTATPAARYQGGTLPTAARPASVQPFRQTPTPPQPGARYAPGTQSQFQAQIRSPPPSASTPQVPSQPFTQTPPVTYSQPFQPPPTSVYQQAQPPSLPYEGTQPHARPTSASGAVDLRKLHLDIDDLTTDAKIECATHPMDPSAQRKLATLQTLKEILDSGNASESDLVEIRNSIMQEMAKRMAAKHQPLPSSPMPILPAHGSVPLSYAPPSQPPPPAALPSFLNPTNLAELLRATASQNQPPPNYAAPYTEPQHAVRTPPVVHATAVPPPVGEMPLLAQLRASGLLSAAPTPPQGGTPPVTAGPASEVPFTSASIRIPRPHLITTFLHSRPNQCSTCGRRFTSDEAGREKKARHLDWHFKTKARMLEAEKRGQNRSWYVDEREWIASREYEDDAGPGDGALGNGSTPSPAKQKAQDFVRAPTDPVLRALPCPIDQEPFKSEWSEEVQDFIWKDAIQVGGRYYHASCYKEITKNGEGISTPGGAGRTGRTATPDSVLGKRKAEQDEANGVKSKIKLETLQPS